MAYFANGTEGEVFDNQCGQCRYGDQPCPIAWVQTTYNHDACNNETATDILNYLVKQDGSCKMFELDQDHFYDRRLRLFDRPPLLRGVQ